MDTSSSHDFSEVIQLFILARCRFCVDARRLGSEGSWFPPGTGSCMYFVRLILVFPLAYISIVGTN